MQVRAGFLSIFAVIILFSQLACQQQDADQAVQKPVAKDLPNLTEKIRSEPKEFDLDDADLGQSKDALLVGTAHAICYSGYRVGQHPDRGNGARNPTYEQTLEDLQILTRNSNFKLLRVYDSGENSETILKVISENDLEIKVLLGIWLKAELSTHESCAWLNQPIPQETLDANRVLNQEEIARGIALAKKYPGIVVAVNVGNEALVDWNDHKVATEDIISYVKQVKDQIEQPVTVSENYKWWADNGKELAAVCDFVAIHLYPVWEGKNIDQAMPFTIENLNEVRKALPDCKMVITEAGWATVSSEFGARAGQKEQTRYFHDLMSWADQKNITTFFFEAFDEPWKGDPNNELGAEKHWGLFTVERKPKRVMREFYPDL